VDEAERQFRTGLNSRDLAPAMRITALNNLGIASAIKGRREEAELAFKEAIRLDQKNAETRGNLGRLYLETRRYREAATELEEAIRLKRSDANLYRLLGEVYYHQGMKELAALELAKALSLKVDLPEARALLNKISRERASERGKRG
jgi:Flp pilus assembly protein TadD